MRSLLLTIALLCAIDVFADVDAKGTRLIR